MNWKYCWTTGLLCCFLLGCSQGIEFVPDTTGGSTVDLPWPPPPGPALEITPVTRASSELDFDFDGVQFTYESGSHNAVHTNGTAFILGTEPGEIAWAIYRLAIPGGELPVSATLYLAAEDDLATPAPPPVPYYLGLANYGKESWVWSGPFTTAAGHAALFNPSASRETYTGTGDDVYVAVVAATGSYSGSVYPAVTHGTLTTTGTPGNIQPVAVLSHSPAVVNQGGSFAWDASASSDSDGAITDYEWDFDENGVFNEAGTDEEAARGSNQYSIVYGPPGIMEATVRVTDDDGSTNTAQDTARVNEGPTPSLTATPLKQQVFQLITLDASGSSDSDGSIVNWDWDLDGNSIFGETGVEADAAGNDVVLYYPQHTGEWSVSVRLTDNDGAVSTAYTTITAIGWVENELYALSGVPIAGLDLVENFTRVPCASFVYDGNLKYAVGNDIDGSAFEVLTVDSVDSGAARPATSLALINSVPAIAYNNLADQELRYAYSSTDRGGDSGDWTSIVVDTDSFVGEFCSLVEAGPGPAIAYYDTTNTQLRYAYSTDNYGASDWHWYFLSNWDNPGNYCSLAAIEGKPVLCAVEADFSQAFYYYSTEVQGVTLASWSSLSITPTLEPDPRTKLIVNGVRPIYLGIEDAPASLISRTAPDITGASWSGTMVADLTGEVTAGSFDFALAGGYPVAALFLASTSKLYVWRSQDGYGMSGWDGLGVFDVAVPNVNAQVAVADVNGKPAIAWWDGTTGAINYAIYFD